MTRPSILWRLVVGAERFLPSSVLDAAVAGPPPVNRRRQRWVLLVAMLPSMTFAIVQFVRARAAMPAVWPMWRPMILQLTLVVAGGVLVAAVAASVVAWRREGRRHA